MAFGRLDVYWPDGPIEIYQLEKPAIGIGRQRGNDVVLNTNAVSRYHTSLTFENNQCHIQDLDSVNGTYVDGVRLDSNEPYLLRGGEELQIGDVRAVFHPPAEASLITPADVEDTQVLELTQPTFQVTLEGAEQIVTPGMHARSQLVIENIGNEADHYFIEIDGVPQDWVRVDRVEVSLEPGDVTRIVASFKPPRRSESVIGDYAISVHVRARSQPAQTISARIDLHVLAYYAFGMRLEKEANLIRAEQPFTVHLHNQGNSPVTVSLSGRDTKSVLNYHFQPQTFNLQPGQRLGALATVEMPWSQRRSGETDYPFAIVATSHDAASWQAAIPGRLHIPSSRFDRARLPLIGAGVIVALLVVAALALLLTRPTPPEILSPLMLVAPTGQPIKAGDELTLSWQVANAAQLQLSVQLNSQLLDGDVTLDSESGQYNYIVSESGEYQFNLEARNGDLSAESAEPLAVVVQPWIVHFDVTPSEWVQGVRQEITMSWEAQGATSVRIDGLEVLLCTGEPPLGDTLVPQGSQTVSVCPPDDNTEAFTIPLGLVALGNNAPNVESTLTMSVTLAECQLIGGDSVTLYDVEGRPPLAMLAQDVMVYAQARGPAAEWIRVATQTGKVGWLRADAVSCETFNIDNLVNQAAPVPVLTPTPTPTPTPTDTPTATSSPTATNTATATPTASPTQQASQ